MLIIDDLDESLKNANIGLEYNKFANNQIVQCQIFNIMAATFLKKGDTVSSIEYFHKAKEIAKKIKAYDLEINILSNIGEVFFESDSFDEALKYYKQALFLNKKNKNVIIELSSNVNIAKTELQLKNFDKSVKYALKVEVLANKTDNFMYLLNAFTFLKDAYKNIENTEKYNEYKTKEKQLKIQFEDQNEINKLVKEINAKELALNKEELSKLITHKKDFLIEKIAFKKRFYNIPFKKQQVILAYAEFKKLDEIFKELPLEKETIRSYRKDVMAILDTKNIEKAIFMIRKFIIEPIW